MNSKKMGIIAFVPGISFVLTFVFMIIGSIGMAFAETSGNEAAMLILSVVMILAVICSFVAAIMAWVGIIWFIILACKNPTFDTTQKVLWCIGLYCLNVFIFPVYWAKYLRD